MIASSLLPARVHVGTYDSHLDNISFIYDPGTVDKLEETFRESADVSAMEAGRTNRTALWPVR